MTRRGQKIAALSAAATALAVLLAANAHLVAVALGSQPDCVVVEGAAAPAKPAC